MSSSPPLYVLLQARAKGQARKEGAPATGSGEEPSCPAAVRWGGQGGHGKEVEAGVEAGLAQLRPIGISSANPPTMVGNPGGKKEEGAVMNQATSCTRDKDSGQCRQLSSPAG